MAVDPKSGELMYMGGGPLAVQRDGQGNPTWPPDEGTWLWDGSTWTRVADNPGGQGGRSRLAVDVATDQLIAYCAPFQSGGYYPPTPAPWYGWGTFLWSGNGWKAVNSAILVGTSSGMAYDPISRRVIDFGGFGNGVEDTTLTFDGTSWSLLRPATTPPGGVALAATDPASGELLMLDTNATDLNPTPQGSAMTWSWDGSDWVGQSVGAEPPAEAVQAGQLVWDPAVSRLVLIGSLGGAGSVQVWVWDGPPTGWVELTP